MFTTVPPRRITKGDPDPPTPNPDMCLAAARSGCVTSFRKNIFFKRWKVNYRWYLFNYVALYLIYKRGWKKQPCKKKGLITGHQTQSKANLLLLMSMSTSHYFTLCSRQRMQIAEIYLPGVPGMCAAVHTPLHRRVQAGWRPGVNARTAHSSINI